MSAIFEGRQSDSPYIEMLWRGRVLADYQPVCPADVRWNLLFVRHKGKVSVSAEGATTQTITKQNYEGAEFFVIKFALGVFLPDLPPDDLVNGDVKLPGASSRRFWMNGFAWDMPDFENVEGFVERLVREDVLLVDPVVKAAVQEQAPPVSSRTLRRRFLQATGLTPKAIQQIERANTAAALLGQGTPILDAVYALGYSDQPHLTRSLKRYIGQTPAQIARLSDLA